MGILEYFRISTPRPSLSAGVESVEAAMRRLNDSTDRLETLLASMRTEEGTSATAAHEQRHAVSEAHEQERGRHGWD